MHIAIVIVHVVVVVVVIVVGVVAAGATPAASCVVQRVGSRVHRLVVRLDTHHSTHST